MVDLVLGPALSATAPIGFANKTPDLCMSGRRGRCVVTAFIAFLSNSFRVDPDVVA